MVGAAPSPSGGGGVQGGQCGRVHWWQAGALPPRRGSGAIAARRRGALPLARAPACVAHPRGEWEDGRACKGTARPQGAAPLKRRGDWGGGG